MTEHAPPEAGARPRPSWSHYTHGADIGVRGRGPSKASAFEQAALALAAVVADPAQLGDAVQIDIACEAPDDELLLADWLNALVYEMAVGGLLFSRFEVRLEPGRLQAKAWGERVDLSRHEPVVEVKGATYTTLRVAQEPDGAWVAQCVVDV
ncbi:archease [Ectothiorhodospiraceae bacterium 2226]|nr:archease [Ectothiorhodospiraceae bacterium 2226]